MRSSTGRRSCSLANRYASAGNGGELAGHLDRPLDEALRLDHLVHDTDVMGLFDAEGVR